MLFPRQSEHRRGASTLEAIVALTLLNSVLAVATPLVVRHGRLLQTQQHYRLALDELSNQIDRLTLVPSDELGEHVVDLQPSPFILDHLPGVQLRGKVAEADSGLRIQLQITWAEVNRQAAPLSLTAWRFSQGD